MSFCMFNGTPWEVKNQALVCSITISCSDIAYLVYSVTGEQSMMSDSNVIKVVSHGHPQYRI